MSLPKLTEFLLASGHAFPAEMVVHRLLKLPEKVLQFGEGNFLRGFVDWMISRMNARGLFNGSVVVVQPIPQGVVDKVNGQDGLYTMLLRGIQGGKPVEEKEIVTAVSRGLNPYADFAGFLTCAENPDLRFIVSNTTEAGIVFRETDQPTDAPPASFPGKLTGFLHHRFRHFGGVSDKGCVMLPCELVERNGDALKRTVIQTARHWKLETAFLDWLEDHNEFTNTLVDRIVTGFPKDEFAALSASLGYHDDLMDTGEIFHSWVIESRWNLADELPLTQAGLNVVWTSNMTPYRERKVRILNGAHTMMALAAYVGGKNTVGECMADDAIRTFVENALHEEIIPTLDLPRDDLVSFAAAVMERFTNPHIQHYLLSIALNSTSKYKARVLPSALEFQKRTGTLPPRLCFALAALMTFYRGKSFRDGVLIGERDGEEYPIVDDKPVQELFFRVWQDFGSSADARALVSSVLGSTSIWGQDLNAAPGMTDAVTRHLATILDKGVTTAMRAIA